MKSCYQPLIFSFFLVGCGKTAVPAIPEAVSAPSDNRGSGDGIATETGTSPAPVELPIPAPNPVVASDLTQVESPAPVVAPEPVPIPVPAPAPAPVPTPVPAINPQNCKAGRASIAKMSMLTTNLNIRLAGQKVRFEVALLNCVDGKVIPIRNQAISFDVELAMATTLGNGYEVFHPATNASLEKGLLNVFDGADINGPMAGYYHWKGAGMNLPAALDKVIIEVTFASAFDTGTTATSMLSFLRLDESDLGSASVPIFK